MWLCASYLVACADGRQPSNRSSQRCLERRSCRLALVGDSIVAQTNASVTNLPPPFPRLRFDGVSGDRVDQIAARVAPAFGAATDVFVQGGINDLLVGTGSRIVPGYRQILDGIPPTKRVIVVGIIQVDEVALAIAHPGWSPRPTNSEIARVNTELTRLCRSYANCTPAIDAMAMTMAGKTADGIHFHAGTYHEWTARLATAL